MKADLTIKDVVEFWLGKQQALHNERGLLLLPFFIMLVYVAASFLGLYAAVWSSPSTAAFVSKLFAFDAFRESFPNSARLYSYVARIYNGPWDIFLSAIMLVNLAGCGAVSVAFMLRTFSAAVSIEKYISHGTQEMLARSRRTTGIYFLKMLFGAAFLVCLLLVMSFGWASNPNRDYSQAEGPIVVGLMFPHFLMLLIPSVVALAAFSLKFWIALIRVRLAPET